MLRPYQQQCELAIQQAVEKGERRLLIPSPVGSGKTVMFSRLPRALRIKGRTLVLVHREELAQQAIDKLRRANPDLHVGLEMAGSKCVDEPIVVASVQSLARKTRLEKYKPDEFSLILTDESHLAAAPSWLRIYEHFHVLPGKPGFDPRKIHIGWTGTPKRTDGKGLNKIFSSIPFQKTMLDLMEDGIDIPGIGFYPYLSDVAAYRVTTEVDLSDVTTRSGDFVTEELSTKIDTPERNELAVRKYLELGEQMQGIAFTVDVAHSKNLAAEFNRQGVKAVAMYGEMPKEERRAAFAAYREGQIDVMTSCMLISVGTDLPSAGVGILCRPTQSVLLLEQMIGRTLRPYPSPEDYLDTLRQGRRPAWVKSHCVLIDICDVCKGKKIASVPSLFGLNKDFDLNGKSAKKVAKRLGELRLEYPEADLDSATSGADVRRILKEHTERIEILKAPRVPPEVRAVSQFSWVAAGEGGYRLRVASNYSLHVQINHLGEYDIYRDVAGVQIWTGKEPSLADALRRAELEVPASSQPTLRMDREWTGKSPTHKQTSLIWKLDRGIQQIYQDDAAYDKFCRKQYRAGDQDYTRKGLSLRISALLDKKQRSRSSGGITELALPMTQMSRNTMSGGTKIGGLQEIR